MTTRDQRRYAGVSCMVTLPVTAAVLATVHQHVNQRARREKEIRKNEGPDHVCLSISRSHALHHMRPPESAGFSNEIGLTVDEERGLVSRAATFFAKGAQHGTRRRLRDAGRSRQGRGEEGIQRKDVLLLLCTLQEEIRCKPQPVRRQVKRSSTPSAG